MTYFFTNFKMLMNIELKYGMGWEGTSYYLHIDGEEYELSPVRRGPPVDEVEARGKAKEILKELAIDINIDTMPFTWNGTM